MRQSKHSTLMGGCEEDGLKDADLQSKLTFLTSCKAIWIINMLNKTNFIPR